MNVGILESVGGVPGSPEFVDTSVDSAESEANEEVKTPAELQKVCAETLDDEVEFVKLDHVGRRLSRLEERAVVEGEWKRT